MERAIDEFNQQCEKLDNDSIEHGVCCDCQNAIFSIDLIKRKRFDAMKSEKRYHDLSRVYDKERGHYLLLNCYCNLMHTFIDESKLQCDGHEEPEPAEI